MKLSKILKIVAALLAGALILLVGVFLLLNTKAFQNRVLHNATEMLSERLNTKVDIDSVSIDFLTNDFKLYGLSIEDQHKRKMLQAEQMVVDVELWPLLHEVVNVTNAEFKGVDADLCQQPGDSVPNYQFLIDALKDTTGNAKGNRRMAIDIHKFIAQQVQVKYNDTELTLAKFDCTHKDNTWLLDIDKLRIRTDNHRPRKNVGKPHRGFFDVGHLDLVTQLKVQLDDVRDDSVAGRLIQCTAVDSVTGIDLRDVHCAFAANKNQIMLKDVVVRQRETQVSFAKATIRLPDHEHGVPFSFATSTVTGHAILHDIARPFAPALAHFDLPLDLRVRVDGDTACIRFHDAVVTRPNNQLQVKAHGEIRQFRDGRTLKGHFQVSEMVARQGEPERIINQFRSRKFMLKQLNKLGNIRYVGSFDIHWKREMFRGWLHTQVGNLNFDFTHDGLEKWLTGTASTQEVQLGKVFDLKDMGPVAASVHFKIDVSKERTAQMRRAKGGKLPIGQVDAQVNKASYKFVESHDLQVSIVSDGAMAEGVLVAPHKFIDLGCTFTFTDTDNMSGMKVKPNIGFHKAKAKGSAKKT